MPDWPTETGEDLAGLLGVQQRLGRLCLHELDQRQPVRTGDHQRVVGVSNDPGQLGLEDLVENRIDGVGVDDGVHVLSLARDQAK